MTTSRNLEFLGLDRLDKLILNLRDDIGYVSVEEVLTRNKNEMVGRAEFSVTEIGAFAGPEPGKELTDDEPLSLGDLAAAPSGPTAQDLAVAMTRWIRHTMATNMSGCQRRVFKVSLWRPKGEGQYTSGRVVCTDPDFDIGDDLGADEPSRMGELVTLPVPQAPPAATVVVARPQMTVEYMPEARPWRALSEGYTNLIGLLQTGYNHLASLQNQTINSQNQQNIRLQRVMEAMTGELVNLRMGLSEADGTRRTDEGESKVREELGKQFIAELGTFGRVVAAAKFGMAPELAEIAELVNASPELMEAMKAPEVRKILRDEATRKELAAILLHAAKSAAAPVEAPSPTPPPPAPPSV